MLRNYRILIIILVPVLIVAISIVVWKNQPIRKALYVVRERGGVHAHNASSSMIFDNTIWRILEKPLNANLAGISYQSLDLTESELQALRLFPELKYLNISESTVVDRDLNLIGKIISLDELSLDNTSITDEGIKQINNLNQLNSLWLVNTNITDHAIETLLNLPRLTEIDVRGTRISADGLRRLKDNGIKLLYENETLSDSIIQE